VVEVGSDIGPNEANQDGPAVVHFLVIELAAAVFEFSDQGCGQGAIFDVGGRLTPLMGFGVVENRVACANGTSFTSVFA